MRPALRRVPPAVRRLIVLLSFVAPALALGGCGRVEDAALPTAPRAPSNTAPSLADAGVAPADVAARSASGGFVDLVVGDHAEAAREFRMRVLPTGATEPGPWITVHDLWTRTIEGTEVRGAETYYVEHVTFVEDDGNQGEWFDLYRQDRSGLYLYQEDVPGAAVDAASRGAGREERVLARADRALAAQGLSAGARGAYLAATRTLLARLDATCGPASAAEFTARASGAGGSGIAPHEITALRYPLRPGASWEGRAGFNVRTVEGREPLLVPAGRFAAVRMRIELPQYFGPRDRYTTWYADAGEVAHVAYLEGQAVDEQGQVIGTAETEDRLDLTRWQPAGRR